MAEARAAVELKSQSEFLCSKFGSAVFTPPACLRKYYDCITQTIFMCKKVQYVDMTLRRDAQMASD